MYTGTEPEKNAVHDAIKDVVPNFEAIGWETKIREISSDQIFNLVTNELNIDKKGKVKIIMNKSNNSLNKIII